MELETSIDYLTVTTKDESSVIRHPALGLSHKDMGRGMFGYKVATRFTDGRIEAYHPDRKEMGRMMSYTGDAIDAARSHVDDYSLLKWHVGQDHRITRLDIAIDAYDSEICIDTLKQMVKSGEVRTNTKSFYMGDSITNEGKTLYIGYRTQKTVRVYDKAAEQKIEGNWKRIEFQLRSDYAADAAREIASESGNEYGCACALIKQFVDFDNPAWQEVLSGTSEAKIKTPKKGVVSNREKWLLSDVSKAIAKEIEDGNIDIMDKILRQVMLELQISADDVKIHSRLI